MAASLGTVYTATRPRAALRALSSLDRRGKRLVAMALDAGLAVASLWGAWSLRLGLPFGDFRSTWYLFVAVALVGVAAFAGLGVYGWVVRTTGAALFARLAQGCLLTSLALVLVTYLFPPERVNPRSLFVIFALLLLLGTAGLRLAWQALLGPRRRGEPVAIYGAGDGGRWLHALLGDSEEYRPVAFVDDDARLAGRTLGGLPVLSGADPELARRLERFEVRRIVLAMPSLDPDGYRRKLVELERVGLPVRTMPSIVELVTGEARADEIRDVSINDLLGRREVVPDPGLVAARVRGRCVLVTGGGGSIGSELCRQVVRLGARRLVVLDDAEANLYGVTEELRARVAAAGSACEFVPVLGSVGDPLALERLFAERRVHTVLHAAAYKHVPIVEAQPEAGVRTNVFGTLTLLDAALAAGVDDFVLISTDKAVRASSAMGATKRVAELVLQAKARAGGGPDGGPGGGPDGRPGTRISMVRFGNVLGSSGSVVPKFRAQILAGGPVTLTHPDATRYFMTIPEAAQLVLQASSVARGGEVFVLDMGEPVRIEELARTMVRLLGRRLRSETNDPADVELVVEGLRPGEKMHEELFVGDRCRATEVAKVLAADEAWLEWSALAPRLDALRAALEAGDRERLRAELMALSAVGSFPERRAGRARRVPAASRARGGRDGAAPGARAAGAEL